MAHASAPVSALKKMNTNESPPLKTEDIKSESPTKNASADSASGVWPKVAVEYDIEEYELRKRLPARFPVHKNDVYVTRRTNFKAQLERCRKLLDAGFLEIYIHGLGSAVNRALNLSLQLKRRAEGTLDSAVNTSSLEVTDDLLPLLDELVPKVRVRHVSAVHIKLFVPENPVTNY